MSLEPLPAMNLSNASCKSATDVVVDADRRPRLRAGTIIADAMVPPNPHPQRGHRLLEGGCRKAADEPTADKLGMSPSVPTMYDMSPHNALDSKGG